MKVSFRMLSKRMKSSHLRKDKLQHITCSINSNSAMERWRLFLPILLCYLLGLYLLDNWNSIPRRGDDVGYYLHLVSAMVNQDVGDYQHTLKDLQADYPEAAYVAEDKFMIRETAKGKRYIKYTLGTALLQLPFFAVAHVYATHHPAIAADGWHDVYFLSIAISCSLYVVLGLWLLMRTLQRYFSGWPLRLTILGLALGTNLFFFANYMFMAHGYLFFAHCLLIYCTVRFYERPGSLLAVACGAVVGVISITRVPELIGGLVPVLWGVHDNATLRQRLLFFRDHFSFVLLFLLGQLAYWYYVSGQLIFNPYEGEGFNFLKPMIYKGWFDFANGWLIYTPLMIFSLLGLIWLRRYAIQAFWPVVLFVLLHAWIHYSYYVWAYFPGLGSRPMVDAYPLLSFPLAAFLQQHWKPNWKRSLLLSGLTFFAILNLFQTWQMRKGLIWTERGTPGFYWETLFATQSTIESLRAFDLTDPQPDENRLVLIEWLAREGFENYKPASQATIAYRGEQALHVRDTTERIDVLEKIPIDSISGSGWLKVSTQAFMQSEGKIWQRDKLAKLWLELRDQNGVPKRREKISISAHIGNPRYSIWSTGDTGQWGEAAFFVKLPRSIPAGFTATVFIQNRHGQQIFLDEVSLGYYR